MSVKSNDLNDLLSQTVFTTRDIAFFMGEMRKLVEKEKLPLTMLKFYCDWSLHPQKDRVSAEMKALVKEVYDRALQEINHPTRIELRKKFTDDFLYFKSLRLELKKLLVMKSLPTNIVDSEEIWIDFVRSLVKVLEEQPLVEPIPEVSSFEYIPSGKGAVIAQLNFTSPPNVDGKEYPYYEAKNYY